MSFRDRSPLRNGSRFRQESRPGPGLGGRVGDRPRIDDRQPRLDDRQPRLDDRQPRLDDRSGRIDDRGPAPRPDWRERERYDDRGPRGGPPAAEYSRGGGLLDYPVGRGGQTEFAGRGPSSDAIGRGPPSDAVGRRTPEFGRGIGSGGGGPPADYNRSGGPISDYRSGGGPPSADYSRSGGAPPSEFARNAGSANDYGRSGPAGDFGSRGPGPTGEFGGRGPGLLDQRGGLRDPPGLMDTPLRSGIRDVPPRGVPDRDTIPPVRGPPNESRWGDAPAKLAPAGGPAPPVNNGSRSNDCEIIVTHKSLTEYAEFIERRLKKLGLTVDLLFPNEEVPLSRVLSNIAGRGTLYAVVVTQLSEEHTSVTINILYGHTQEHRNIPLEDGLQLLVRNFEAYTRGDKAPAIPAPGGVPVNPTGIPLGPKHPEIVYTLLGLLIDNKPLTVLQYEKLISYLQDRREAQLKLEVGDNVGGGRTGLDYGDPQKTQHQLQNRILDILKSSDGPKPDKLMGSGPSGGGHNMHMDAPPLLKDPSLQKAIESIVQSNLYKNATVGGPPPMGGGPPRGYGSSYGGRK